MAELPADGHVHSEWSWDTGGPESAAQGTMARSCERAVRIGLPALVVSEHFDFDDAWRAVSFGSDAHVPELLGHGFPEARHMVEHFGFHPGARPGDLWKL